MQTNAKETLIKAKADYYNEIVNSTEMSKHEKLAEFRAHNLLRVHTYNLHPFRKYVDALKDRIKESTLGFCIIDVITSDYDVDRHVVIYYDEFIEQLYETIEYGVEQGKSPLVRVVWERSDGDVIDGEWVPNALYEICIPIEEVIDTLYDFAIESQTCGFTNDW
jgi:hypothetical protein